MATLPDEWPDTLPKSQMPTESYQDSATFDEIDVLQGPSRRRRRKRIGRSAWTFEVWFTAAQAQAFDAWYTTIVQNYGGRFVIPWMSRSRIVAFADPYELRALGTGWRLAGTVVAVGSDPARCEAHINAVFGNILRDPLNTADIFQTDLGSSNFWIDDFPLDLIATEVC
jgi:hypothetical protein